jgi:hypothetical protein
MPDVGTLAPGKFYADYPLWTILNRDQQIRGIPGSVAVVNPRGQPPMLGVFTDEDLASSFIEKVGWNAEPLKVGPSELLAIVEHFMRTGVQYVAVDISSHPAGSSLQLHPIGEFVDDVRRSQIQ